MKLVRSALFVFLFYVNTFVQMLFWVPVYFFFPRKDCWRIVRIWGLSNLWLQHFLVGTRFDFRGIENLPEDDGFVLASKHQSTWETYATLLFIKDPSYILKRELMFIPLFGWFAWKAEVIAVNRGRRSEALRQMNQKARQQLSEGRQIVIYPEGTRREAFAAPAYKYGVTHMYENIGATVVPAATNSGMFWPRNSFQLYCGTCILEFLPALQSGLGADEFSRQLQSGIEGKTTELLSEALADPEYDGKSRFAHAQTG